MTNLLLLTQGLSHGREAGKNMPIPAKSRCFASNWPLFSNAATANGWCVELGLLLPSNPWASPWPDPGEVFLCF